MYIFSDGSGLSGVASPTGLWGCAMNVALSVSPSGLHEGPKHLSESQIMYDGFDLGSSSRFFGTLLLDK